MNHDSLNLYMRGFLYQICYLSISVDFFSSWGSWCFVEGRLGSLQHCLVINLTQNTGHQLVIVTKKTMILVSCDPTYIYIAKSRR